MRSFSVVFIVLVIMFFEACTVMQKPDIAFEQILHNLDSTRNKQIRFEGAYHNNATNGYYLGSPVFFFQNGLVYFDNSSSRTATENEIWIHKYFAEQKSWGVYEIENDTIKVRTYFPFYDYRAHYLLTSFQGIVKNRDTILQWHMVEPYPKLNDVLLKYYDFLFKDRKDLYFKPVPTKSFMDSIAQKAYINKYRKDDL